MTIRTVERHRLFVGYFEKLSAKQRRFFYVRLELFVQNPRSPLLRVHKLSGNLEGFHAFSAGGDLRVVFRWASQDHVILYRIGSHNQAYR